MPSCANGQNGGHFWRGHWRSLGGDSGLTREATGQLDCDNVSLSPGSWLIHPLLPDHRLSWFLAGDPIPEPLGHSPQPPRQLRSKAGPSV